MWCVILQPKGTYRNALLPADQKDMLTPAAVGGILRRAIAPELIGTYKWNGMTLHLFAYKTGKAGTENKHELPPPHNKVLVFGDIVVIATKGSAQQLLTFATADYQKFQTDEHGGFEDVGSHDSETDEDDDDEEVDEEEVEEEDDEVEESEEDKSVVTEVVEEEEEAPKPVRKPSAAAIKRNNKKLPAWYVHTQLTPEDYDSPPDSKAPQETRKSVKTIIQSRCGFLSAKDQIDFERGIYNYTIEDSKRRIVHSVWENPEFTQLYLINARRTISNLDPSSYIHNARLLERFHEGEFRPNAIAFMNYSDLFPEKWGARIELAIKREAKMLEVDKSMATEMFKCSRCGKRQCTYYEMQTRSADEPMTQFVRCLNCGKQWRQ